MLYSTLEDSPSNISWVKNEQLHLTLKFLGHTPEAIFDNIKSEISKIASIINPFKLVIDKTGCFPKKERPRVLWLGINGNTIALNDLFLRIDKKMDKIGFPCLDKEFFPIAEQWFKRYKSISSTEAIKDNQKNIKKLGQNFWN